MNNYLPCPFCASKDIRLFNCAGISIDVRCMDCSCALMCGLISSRGTEQAMIDATEKWNTRLLNGDVIVMDLGMKLSKVKENKMQSVPITTEEIMRNFNVTTKGSSLPSVAKGSYDGDGVYEKAQEPTCTHTDAKGKKIS